MTEAWVLSRAYAAPDRTAPAFHIERVYADEARAREDHDLLTKTSGTDWHLDKVPVIGDFHGKKAQRSQGKAPLAAPAKPNARPA